MEITTNRRTQDGDGSIGGDIVIPARRRRRMPRTLAWLAVAPFAAWAVFRVAGLERGSLPTQLMTATPYIAAGSLLPLAVAALSRSRAAAAVALVTATALGLSVLPRAFGSAETAASGPPFKVLTANLLFGRADADQVVDLVRRLEPDVISFQELTPGAVTELDDAGLKELMPYRVLEDDWSAGGAGTYARHPLTRVDGLFEPVGHHMPVASLRLPGSAPVEIVNVHPTPPLRDKHPSWAAALKSFPGTSEDVVRILAGDFNASLDHALMRQVLDRGYADAADQVGQGLVPTWPAGRRIPPLITIDHVLVDRRVGVRDVSVHDLRGTDHRAVFAELRLPPS